MLADQRLRMPDFIQHIQSVIDKEGMSKVEELFKVKARTIRLWIKGDQESVSSSFADYEKKI